MNYSLILKKGEALLLWIYKNFTDKFINIFQKLKHKFPVLDRYPLLKYSLIPVLIALFFLARYIIKLVIDELAAWTSNFVGETAGYSISEGTIVLSIAAVFIVLRLSVKLINSKNKKSNKLELNYEKAS